MPRTSRIALLSVGLLVACGGSSAPPTTPCTQSCPCQVTSDCPQGQFCEASFCVSPAACSTNTDCPEFDEVCAAGACIPSADTDGGGAVAGPDAGARDGGVDAGRDAGALDAGADAGSDAGPSDAGGTVDSGVPDAGADAGPDAGFDAGPDGGADAGVDAGADGGPVDSSGDSGVPDSGGPQCHTSAECVGGQVCLGGACVPCTDDSQCAPPASVCQGDACGPGCLPGGCGAGQTCDDFATGRCVPALGAAATGQACETGSDCAGSAQSTAEGLCIEVGDAGVCSGLCQSTRQCPSGMVCDPLGFTGVCLSAALLGITSEVGGGAVGQACTGFQSCDSVALDSCGDFSGTGNVCTDSCQGQGVGCPPGWPCATLELFDPDAGQSCALDAGVCALADPNSDCFTAAEGGDNHCHQAFRADECFAEPFIGFPSGNSCGADSDCASSWCLGGQCAAPCCTSGDCPAPQACAPILGPSGTDLLACDAPAGTGSIGAPCTAQSAGGCRSGFCMPQNPYLAEGEPGFGQGYCTDTCCSDAQCGAGYACTITAVVAPDGGTLYVPLCSLL